MARIEGVKKVQAKLQALIRKAKNETDSSVVVGFTQVYAVHVHEDTDAQHAEGKTAKYLEGPARTLKNVLAKMIEVVVRKTGSIRKGLAIAGLRLQREAQKIVPIDTGALKASAFTAFEEEVEVKAKVAFEKSEVIRLAGLNKKKRK